MGRMKDQVVLAMERKDGLVPPEVEPIATCSIRGCLIYDTKDIVRLQGGDISCDDCAYHREPPDPAYPSRRRSRR